MAGFVLQDPFGVAVGGTLGHCLCTGLAVIGGRMVAQKISVRTGEIDESFTTVHNVLLVYMSNDLYPDYTTWYFLLLFLQLQSLVGSFSSPSRSLPSLSSPILDSDEWSDSWFHFVHTVTTVQHRRGTERYRGCTKTVDGLFAWVNLFCVSERMAEWKTVNCSCLNEHFNFLLKP